MLAACVFLTSRLLLFCLRFSHTLPIDRICLDLLSCQCFFAPLIIAYPLRKGKVSLELLEAHVLSYICGLACERACC